MSPLVSIGWDGTVIQQELIDLAACVSTVCHGTVRWWPRLIR